VVRVAPDELSFIYAQAWKDIYGFRPAGITGNRKDQVFYNFASGLIRNMINADPETHARARRIFSNAFSDKALQEQEPLFMKYIDLMVRKLHECASVAGKKVDMVRMYNFITFDIMGILSPLSHYFISFITFVYQATSHSANHSTCSKTPSTYPW
jgi:hypothetical protein